MQYFYTYLWIRLPIILMFANGYLVYRLLAVTGLTDVFVFRSVRKSKGNLNYLLMHIITAATLLSFFIPNAITVLILLPILKNIEQDISLQAGSYSLSTALTLSAIYGANIGGMGSLIGSPANLLLIGALDLYEAAGREHINFFTWFIWSVPLVAVFTTAAFALIILLAVPKHAKGMVVVLKETGDKYKLSPARKSGVFLFVIFLAFWILEAIIKELTPAFALFESPVCIFFFIIFCFLLFARSPGFNGAPLLRFKDIITGLPRRGILFLCLLVPIIMFFRFFRLDRQAADLLRAVISQNISFFAIILLTVLAVIFLTEVLSNTVVSTAFFPIAYFFSIDNNISPLILMTGVSIASTCAFMTPVATPCNALAFGEMKGASFRLMLVMGLLLNIIGAFLITVWLRFIIPLVYQ